MNKKRKKCTSCGDVLDMRRRKCKCGEFIEKPKRKPTLMNFMQDFILNMLEGRTSSNYQRDMGIVKKIFEVCDYDLAFLSKVKKPFHFKETSLGWFGSQDGLDYIKKKHAEFKYKVPEKDKIVDSGRKSGKDSTTARPKTLRDFLNE